MVFEFQIQMQKLDFLWNVRYLKNSGHFSKYMQKKIDFSLQVYWNCKPRKNRITLCYVFKNVEFEIQISSLREITFEQYYVNKKNDNSVSFYRKLKHCLAFSFISKNTINVLHVLFNYGIIKKSYKIFNKII